MVTSVGSVWVGMGKEKRTSCCLSLVYRHILYSFWFQLPLPVKGEDLPYSDTSSSKRPKDASPYRRRLSTGLIPVPRCRKTSTTLPEIPDVPMTPLISLSVVSSYAESPRRLVLPLHRFTLHHSPQFYASPFHLSSKKHPFCYLSGIFFFFRLPPSFHGWSGALGVTF